MEFKTMGADEYRALDADAFEERRSLVISELDNADSKVPFADLNSEVNIIEQEVERRNAAVNLRNATMAAVKKGEGAVLESTEKKGSFEVTRSEDPFDTEAYNRAFMDYFCRGKEFPAGLVQPGQKPAYVRADAYSTTSDVPHFIPTTLADNIITKMSEYGAIYNEVTKLGVPGGYEINVWDWKPTASWVTEKKSSDAQKATDASRIVFAYYMLECKVATSFLAGTVTLDAFRSKFPELVSEAMTRAIEDAIMNGTGSGQPLGILNDPRVTNKVDFAAADIAKYQGWATILKTLTNPYRQRGKFYMAQDTWDKYLEGMVDANGQPVARVNYGIDGAETYRVMGKQVTIVTDDILPSYDDAAAGKPFMLFGQMSDYLLNQQAGMRSVKWLDEDNNLEKQKMQLICDGKMGDTNGMLVVSKPSA